MRRGLAILQGSAPPHPNRSCAPMPPHGPPVPTGPSLSPEPTFLAFLPILCAVWADGLMEDAELDAVSGALDGAEWMTPEGRAEVFAWLDPAAPPAAPVFAEAVKRIRGGARGSVTLARAGVTVAQRAVRHRMHLRALSGVEPDDGVLAAANVVPWRDQALATLGRVELELGLAGPEALRELTEAADERELPAEPPPGVVDEIAAHIHGGYHEVRSRVREALARPELSIPDEIPRGEYRERTLTAVKVLADMGLGVAAYPREWGGLGDPGAAVAAFEELALGDLSVLVKFGVQFGLFGGSIAQLGTEKHHRRYLRQVATLALPGCYAMTETGHGSNVRDLRTTADYDATTGEFVIDTPDDDARKDYIGNAALHGRMATVFARLRLGHDDHGVHAFLVHIRDAHGAVAPGVHIEDCGAKEGLNGVDNGRIRFDGVRVGADALLDRFARITPDGEYESPIPTAGRRFFTMLGTLVAGRISIAAASQTVTRKALTIAVRYTARRRQFGPAGGGEVPVLDYLSVQRELLPRLAASYAVGFAVRDLTRRFASPDTDRLELEVRAAGLKAAASRLAMDTLQGCREACGGQGYLAENQFARLKADTDVFTTFEGANPVLLQLVAKGLLSRFRRDLGDLTMWGMARYLAELAGTRLAEMNPVVTRRTDPDHLADSEFQLAAFHYREQRLMRSAARRVKARMDQGMDSFDAVNACQDHLITLARAHVDRIVLESALEALAGMDECDGRELIARVIALHGLATLETDRAWFLETGYFEPAKSEAVRREVNALCRELAPRARELVDAFRIPDELLAAPIGKRG
ncbi:MAG: acyl-CoA oxidase [Gemmatimonadetes bacterium]|nr:acyl-CoA oxidase [Gemmatimonadota bacterium]